MKVLWLGHNLAFPPKGGALQRNYNLLLEVSKQCEVHVLAFDQPATRPSTVTADDCVKALTKFCVTAEWVQLSSPSSRWRTNCRVLGSWLGSDPYETRWLRHSEMAARLHSFLSQVPIDVIHFDTIGLAQYLPIVRRLGINKRMATVLNHHDVQSAQLLRRAAHETNYLSQALLKREARNVRRAEQFWCPLMDLNLTVSEEEKTLLDDAVNHRAKVEVVPNGVDPTYFATRSDPQGKTIIFCGKLDKYSNKSGIKYFFQKIWPLLTILDPRIEIAVMGRDPPLWLKKLGKADGRIHVTGFVDDVRPYFKKAVAFVCPVFDGGGTQLKVLDALAMGVPTVATTFSVMGLNLKHEIHVLLGDTPEEFARHVMSVISDVELRCRLTAASTLLVHEAFSWSQIGPKINAAYQQAFDSVQQCESVPGYKFASDSDVIFSRQPRLIRWD